MQKPAVKTKTPMSKKQIPTLLGLGVLIISLVAGLMMFGEGTGVFAPRATPQTTPKNVKVTNLTDKSFTAVFYTDESTNGFLKYGTTTTSMKTQATDDRDQLSGSIGNYRLHHITVRGLTPNTNYSYVLGTASGSGFDDEGTPFSVKTLSTSTGAPPTNKTIYGTITTEAGAPAEGSVVFVSSPGVGEMSSLVKSSGSWALALSNARKSDGTGYMEFADTDLVNIIAQGVEPTKVSSFSNQVGSSQPVPEITLGQTPQAQDSISIPVEETSVPEENVLDISDLELSAPVGSLTDFIDLEEEIDSGSDSASEVIDQTSTETITALAEEVLDLSVVSESDKPVMVSQPVIKGRAAPNVEVSIEVHSDAEILQTVTADSDGDFTLNVIELQKFLEPGDHTVTYSYVDPTTGTTMSKTQSFIVQAADAFADNTSPFGSGNPFPVEVTPEPTTPVASVTAEPSTRSAIVSTDSGTYTAGSVGNTLALIIGGLFFMFTGLWSWWLAHEAESVG
jgi:hypothetical protein